MVCSAADVDEIADEHRQLAFTAGTVRRLIDEERDARGIHRPQALLVDDAGNDTRQHLDRLFRTLHRVLKLRFDLEHAAQRGVAGETALHLCVGENNQSHIEWDRL